MSKMVVLVDVADMADILGKDILKDMHKTPGFVEGLEATANLRNLQEILEDIEVPFAARCALLGATEQVDKLKEISDTSEKLIKLLTEFEDIDNEKKEDKPNE